MSIARTCLRGTMAYAGLLALRAMRFSDSRIPITRIFDMPAAPSHSARKTQASPALHCPLYFSVRPRVLVRCCRLRSSARVARRRRRRSSRR